MPKYRTSLPQLNGGIFLLDGGIETTMLFLEELELPLFAAFHLLDQPEAEVALNKYFHNHCKIAQSHQVGFIFETITWRASSDWAQQLGYSKQALAEKIHQSVEMFAPFRQQYENDKTKMIISGCIGPRGDGYVPDTLMSVAEAEDYHAEQISTFSKTDADMVSALTMNYVDEAIGITKAAVEANIPMVVSFTVETDGNLIGGESLQSAIEAVEEATNQGPAYYMINCAHPTHFQHVFRDEPWVQRIQGLRANASTKSHAELDESEVLDEGNPYELGAQYRELMKILPNLNVLGGCCGTDHRHIQAIADACI